MAGQRPYDLVLLGATGFTGRLVAGHLGARAGQLRWAVAGRRADALEAVAEQIAATTGGTPPAVEVVDVHDLVGLLGLAGRTRVLATTVGPYARHGELVVQACVRQGTDYADITGEPAFVELVRARYHADAAQRGLRLINCCGFDSVPHDLGAAFTAGHLPADAALTVRGYVTARGRLSGGTLHSALEATRTGRTPRRSGPVRGEPDPVRPTGRLPARLHRVEQLDGWGVPLPTIDAAIVLRSARRLPGYGTGFRYGHFALAHRLTRGVAGLTAMGGLAAAASLPPTRAVLRRLLPDPGDGPDEATRARSSFAVTFLGQGGGREVTTRVSGGDPGYGETAVMLAEAALSLVQDEPTGAVGVLTPAVGLGETYRDRLSGQGLRFELLAQAGTSGAADGSR